MIFDFLMEKHGTHFRLALQSNEFEEWNTTLIEFKCYLIRSFLFFNHSVCFAIQGFLKRSFSFLTKQYMLNILRLMLFQCVRQDTLCIVAFLYIDAEENSFGDKISSLYKSCPIQLQEIVFDLQLGFQERILELIEFKCYVSEVFNFSIILFVLLHWVFSNVHFVFLLSHTSSIFGVQCSFIVLALHYSFPSDACG